MVAAAGLVVAAVAVFGLSSPQQKSKRTRPAGFALTGGTVPLWPVPFVVVQACRQAQSHASFVVLCPSRLPRATSAAPPWEPPSALQVTNSTDDLEFSYGAPAAGLGVAKTLALDQPDRFLHFVVGLATEGIPRGARRARLGGRVGMLAPASAVASYQGAYFGDHVRFVWREHGVLYVATVHTFGQQPTTKLLGQIVARLVPAAQLKAPQRPPDSALVGPSPTGVAIDANSVWVATAGVIASGLNGRLVRIDPVSLRASVRPSVRPKAVRVAVGDGAVWTVGYGVAPDGLSLTPPELARIDPRTGRVAARLSLGRGEGTGIAVGAGSIWVSMVGTDPRSLGRVLRVDPSAMRVVASRRVGRGPASLATDGQSIWVVNATANTVTRLNAITGRPTATVAVGHHPFDVAVGSGSVWISNVADGTISRIDPATNRVIATIPVGAAPYGVATDSRGVWVAVLGNGTVVRIDPQTNAVTGRENVPGDPLAIATDGHVLYVTLNNDGLVLRIRPATRFRHGE